MIEAKYINAFIEATLETFKSMCGCEFKRVGEMVLVDGEIVESDDLLAIVGLTGSVKGAVLLATPLDVGKKLIGKFLMEELTEINCDLMDGFGEIVNILAGAADAKLPNMRIDLALPSVLVGSKTKFFAKAGNPFVMIPMFIPDMGPFKLGISLEILDKK
jgi:chemotaxis protein CheX